MHYAKQIVNPPNTRAQKPTTTSTGTSYPDAYPVLIRPTVTLPTRYCPFAGSRIHSRFYQGRVNGFLLSTNGQHPLTRVDRSHPWQLHFGNKSHATPNIFRIDVKHRRTPPGSLYARRPIMSVVASRTIVIARSLTLGRYKPVRRFTRVCKTI